MNKNIKRFSIILFIVIIMISYFANIISIAGESNLTITPNPETNNIHLKWTGPQGSSYRVYQKKPGSDHFETIGLTDLSKEAVDEEVKVLNVYPTGDDVPKVSITYLDGRQEVIEKSALLKVWMEGRNG
jgi:tetratricopeptide repeat protein